MEVHRREVATIFTDITGFTSLVETAAPEVLGALLNEYVGGMTDRFACRQAVTLLDYPADKLPQGIDTLLAGN